MKKIAFFTTVLIVNFLGAQNIVKKSLLHPVTSSVRIDTNNCYELNLETSEQNEMIVEATIDGEYRKDVLLNIREEGSTVIVSTAFQPNFIIPNDKLSAHKVISIALRVVVPVYRKVQVYGKSCNVTATGNYENLSVILADGRCTLKEVSETANVTTQSGSIFIVSSNAAIKATTKYGVITREAIPRGSNSFALSTISGNIDLKKSE